MPKIFNRLRNLINTHIHPRLINRNACEFVRGFKMQLKTCEIFTSDDPNERRFVVYTRVKLRTNMERSFKTKTKEELNLQSFTIQENFEINQLILIFTNFNLVLILTKLQSVIFYKKLKNTVQGIIHYFE